MKNKIVFILLFVFSINLVAGSQPKFSIKPMGSAVVNVASHGIEIASYRVTNNTKITRTLNFSPLNGVIQNTLLPGSCQYPFTLSQGNSCLLNLTVTDENSDRNTVSSGPIVCKTTSANDNTPSPFLCSQPASSDRLTIIKPESSSGQLQCWGKNDFGQVGVDTGGVRVNPPQPVSQLSTDIKAVATGTSHTCALTNQGGVKCWGSNSMGQLGVSSIEETNIPQEVTGLQSGVKAISAGSEHNCALLNGGEVKCWGGNGFGQLGRGYISGSDYMPETTLPLAGKAIKVTSGGLGVCVLLENGKVQCWGDASFGQLGVPPVGGGGQAIPSPQAPVDLAAPAVNLDSGSRFSCALLNSGKIMCWGRNNQGQLGNTTELGNFTYTPVEVENLNGLPILISTGSEFACAVFLDRTAQCWGANRRGELGNTVNSGTNNPNPTPLTVTGLTGISQLRAAAVSTCAILTTGGLQCWGQNENGELGNPTNDGTKNANVSPLNVTGLSSGVLRLFNNSHSFTVCAITSA